jgi:hypothetical protein
MCMERSGRALFSRLFCFPDCANLCLVFGMGNTILGPDGLTRLWHGEYILGMEHTTWHGSLVATWRGRYIVGMAHSRWTTICRGIRVMIFHLAQELLSTVG